MKKPNKTPFNYGVVITGLIALVILIYVQANKEVKVDETGPESHFVNGKHKVPITEDDEHFIGPKETPEAKKKREAKKKDIGDNSYVRTHNSHCTSQCPQQHRYTY